MFKKAQALGKTYAGGTRDYTCRSEKTPEKRRKCSSRFEPSHNAKAQANDLARRPSSEQPGGIPPKQKCTVIQREDSSLAEVCHLTACAIVHLTRIGTHPSWARRGCTVSGAAGYGWS